MVDVGQLKSSYLAADDERLRSAKKPKVRALFSPNSFGTGKATRRFTCITVARFSNPALFIYVEFLCAEESSKLALQTRQRACVLHWKMILVISNEERRRFEDQNT